MRHAVGARTDRSYSSEFKSLQDFCEQGGHIAIPASPLVLVYWLRSICPSRIQARSASNYLSAIRHAHVTAGVEWTQRSDPIVKQFMQGLRKEFPTEFPVKLPLTASLILTLCTHLPGWPDLNSMRFDDVVYVTASAIASAAALRGGEFTTDPKSTRPLLLDSYISVKLMRDNRQFIVVSVPIPKTDQSALFSYRIAAGPVNTSDYPLDPVNCWDHYSQLKARVLQPSMCKHPDKPRAAFALANGQPLTRDFMVHRTEALMRLAGLALRDISGRLLPVRSASWRAGHVVSALNDNMSEAYIKAAGSWSSQAWQSYASIPIIQVLRAADTLAATAIRSAVAPRRPSVLSGVASTSGLFDGTPRR